jgi:Ca2+-binding RTX toxin-like protein
MNLRIRRLGALASVAALIAGISALLVTAEPAAAAVQCAGLNATIVGTGGPDTLDGTDGSDVIVGGGGGDTIRGWGGNDVICGDDGNDNIDAGAAQDRVYGGPGSDMLSGGAGVDEVSYATVNTGIGVIVDLGSKSAAVSDGNDTLLQFENASGSPYSDQLYGTAQANQLAGLRGSDILVGYGGNDVLTDSGGEPKEINYFKGGQGDDILYGGPANDIADFWDPSNPNPVGVVVDLAAGFAHNQGKRSPVGHRRGQRHHRS